MKRILIATDLSARSDRALQRAVALANDAGAELTMLHVVDDALPKAVIQAHESAARHAMEQQAASLPLAGNVNITRELARGRPHAEIIRCAMELSADLVVLGIHRHTTRDMFRGTTAERVVRYGTKPVLVVKDIVTAPYKRALVAVDLSPQSLAALRLAAWLVRDGQEFVVHVAHRPFSALLDKRTQDELAADERRRITEELRSEIGKAIDQLGQPVPQFEVVVRDGLVDRVIRDQAAAIKPDLVALGTHGRTGLAHAIIGSIAEDLLIDAPSDVLIVKSAH